MDLDYIGERGLSEQASHKNLLQKQMSNEGGQKNEVEESLPPIVA